MTFNQARGIFGFNGESSIGQVGFPAIQVRCPHEQKLLHWPTAFRRTGTDFSG